jgi:putative transposase
MVWFWLDDYHWRFPVLTSEFKSTAALTEEERELAHARYRLLRPFLEGSVPLATVAREHGIPISTAWRWVRRYQEAGLAGLARKERSDRDVRKLSGDLQGFVEGLALQVPRLSAAAIHREAASAARLLGERAPSYATVYGLIRRLDPALVTLAHEGQKTYSETFDLLHRSEAQAPNAIWQADHTELDLLVFDDERKARKPWLTIILDDFSRAVAGYFLSFSSPSALQTSLALRQAIWRKPRSGWSICGIPEVKWTPMSRPKKCLP